MSNEVHYDECGNIKKPTKECKHFHQDPYWTPNNYDLYFDYNSIPVNIEIEGSYNLIKRLKKHLPLSKLLHINMESEDISYSEQFNIHTGTKILFNVVDEDTLDIEGVELELR